MGRQASAKARAERAAKREIDDALAAGEELGEIWWQAEMLRIKANLTAKLCGEDDLEAGLMRAIEVAREQGERPFELRAANDLGRLLLKYGRRREIKAIIEPIYSQFIDGFDTPDLKVAKALLGELA